MCLTGLMRDHQELRDDARHQSAASREILAVLARATSPTRCGADAIVEHLPVWARAAQVFLPWGSVFRVVGCRNNLPRTTTATSGAPIAGTGPSAVGRGATWPPIRSPTWLRTPTTGCRPCSGWRIPGPCLPRFCRARSCVLSMWRTEVAHVVIAREREQTRRVRRPCRDRRPAMPSVPRVGKPRDQRIPEIANRVKSEFRPRCARTALR